MTMPAGWRSKPKTAEEIEREEMLKRYKTRGHYERVSRVMMIVVTVIGSRINRHKNNKDCNNKTDVSPTEVMAVGSI
jgi:hypothetical protein